MQMKDLTTNMCPRNLPQPTEREGERLVEVPVPSWVLAGLILKTFVDNVAATLQWLAATWRVASPGADCRNTHSLPPAATSCNQLTSPGLLPYPKDRAQGLRFPSSLEVCTNGLRHNSTYGTYRAEWPEAWAQPTRCFQEVPPSAPQR